jgi:hypothetical protein
MLRLIEIQIEVKIAEDFCQTITWSRGWLVPLAIKFNYCKAILPRC